MKKAISKTGAKKTKIGSGVTSQQRGSGKASLRSSRCQRTPARRSAAPRSSAVNTARSHCLPNAARRVSLSLRSPPSGRNGGSCSRRATGRSPVAPSRPGRLGSEQKAAAFPSGPEFSATFVPASRGPRSRTHCRGERAGLVGPGAPEPREPRGARTRGLGGPTAGAWRARLLPLLSLVARGGRGGPGPARPAAAPDPRRAAPRPPRRANPPSCSACPATRAPSPAGTPSPGSPRTCRPGPRPSAGTRPGPRPPPRRPPPRRPPPPPARRRQLPRPSSPSAVPTARPAPARAAFPVRTRARAQPPPPPPAPPSQPPSGADLGPAPSPTSALTAGGARTRKRSPRARGGAGPRGRGGASERPGFRRLPLAGRGCVPLRRPPRPRRDRLLPGSCVGSYVRGCMEVFRRRWPPPERKGLGKKLRGESPVRQSGAGRGTPSRMEVFARPTRPGPSAPGGPSAAVRSHLGRPGFAPSSPRGCSHTSLWCLRAFAPAFQDLPLFPSDCHSCFQTQVPALQSFFPF